jgi:hypothetical protein
MSAVRIVCYPTRRLLPSTSTKHVPCGLQAMPIQAIKTTHVCKPSPLHDELPTPPNPQSNQMHSPSPSTSTTPSRQQQDQAPRRCRAAQLVQVSCALLRSSRASQQDSSRPMHPPEQESRASHASEHGGTGHAAHDSSALMLEARWPPAAGASVLLLLTKPTVRSTNQQNNNRLTHPAVVVPGSWCKCPRPERTTPQPPTTSTTAGASCTLAWGYRAAGADVLQP